MKWKKPTGFFPKLNFYGAFDGTKSRLVSGIVVQDTVGLVMLSCAKIHDRVPSSFSAEALACLFAVRVALDQGWTLIEVEGDALSVVKKSKFGLIDYSLISPHIVDIHQAKQ